MSEEQHDASASAPSEARDTAGYRPREAAEGQALQKHLNLPVGQADVMPVEMAKWNRIKRRVNDLEKRWAVNWLAAGASGSASLAVSTAIAAVSIPTGEESGIDQVVQPALFIGAAAAGLLALVCFAFFLLERQSRSSERSDIIDEMETEEDAWEQRSSD